MKSSRVCIALVLATTLLGACDPYTETTVLKTRSAMDVAVQDIDSDSHVARNYIAPVPAEVARAKVTTDAESTSDLIVVATRRPNGEIVTEWQTRLPLVNGERHVLIDSSGETTLEGDIPIDTKNEQLTIPVCGTLVRHMHKTTLIGYDVHAATPCTGSHVTEMELQTPRSNLESVHRVSTNDSRVNGIAIAIVSTVLTGGIGTFVAFEPDRDGDAPSPAVHGVGFGLMAIGLGVDIALLPAIFAPDKDEVVYQSAK